ncbi:Polyketide synthase enoylreductase [Penicillium argentinense]|uniref:Polyketide synthase enoylreductase n=1 Tax=Penicillium argentinense TaxID=1131581 RepID=A0A9W9EX39_9EURO|nr:Polyketide synthase enoylreductase [Penicillium argentinense]KAJ5089471.1 Polyketide synthase enoylreductase [Penicillium argentinense]
MWHLVLEGINNFALKEAPEPTLQSPTDVIVKVSATTICGSDVHFVLGEIEETPWGFPLGHECVGTIHQLGPDVRGFKLGDRVAVSPGVWCNQCDACRGYKYQTCESFGIFGSGKNLGDLGGAQAEFVRVPCADNTLSLIPDGVSDAQALTVGDMLCTGWTGVERAAVGPGATLLVFGAGPVGLCALHSARLQGVAKVIAVDVISDRLEVAKAMGADHVINASLEDVAEVVLELTDGRGAEAIVDAAGVKSTFNAWAPVAALNARISMVAIPSGPVELPLAQLQMKGITVWTGLADPNRTRRDFLLQSIRDGTLEPSLIFTETISFKNIVTGLQEFIERKPGLIKPLIVF